MSNEQPSPTTDTLPVPTPAPRRGTLHVPPPAGTDTLPVPPPPDVQAELAGATQRAERAESSLLDLRCQKAFALAAVRSGAEWAGPQAAEDAYSLIDRSKIGQDGTGAFTGLEDALKDLQMTRRYLFKAAPQPPNINAEDRGAGQTPLTPDERREFAARYGLDPQFVT